jgi:hypothetical protein
MHDTARNVCPEVAVKAHVGDTIVAGPSES